MTQSIRSAWLDLKSIFRGAATIVAVRGKARTVAAQLDRDAAAHGAGLIQISLAPFTPNYASCDERRGDRAALDARLRASRRVDLWVVLIIATMYTVFCITIKPTHSDAIDRVAAVVRSQVATLFTVPAPQGASSLPDVLLVSSNDADYRIATATLSPRGARVILARDVSSAMEEIDAHASFGMVILDAALADGKRLARAIKRRFPDVDLFIIDRARKHERIAAVLLDYASRRRQLL